MRRLVVIAALAAGCPPPGPVGPTDGRLVFESTDEEYDGGRILTQLRSVRGRAVVWVTNDYDVPLTIDVTFKTDNLSPIAVAPKTVITAHKTIAIGSFAPADPRKPWRLGYESIIRFGDASVEPEPYVYALPWAEGSFTVGQGFHGDFSHKGESAFAVDVTMPEGTIVTAAREGIVVATHDKATVGGESVGKSYREANWVVVRHDDGSTAYYGHLAPGGVIARAGQRVGRGEPLGRSGNTGFSSGPHLHFAVTTGYRSWPFVWRTAPDDPGSAPVQGRRYEAFEGPAAPAPSPDAGR